MCNLHSLGVSGLAWVSRKDLVRPERFELPTCCSGGNRSIQLSYGRARIRTVYMGRGNGFNGGMSSAFWSCADSEPRSQVK
jgi:hypothetical protein